MTISVLGAGAFGSALAISWANAGQAVSLWGRNAQSIEKMAQTRRVPRLPNCTLPPTIELTSDLRSALQAEVIIYAAPTQTLRQFLQDNAQHISAQAVIAACKGLDLHTMQGPSALLKAALPDMNVGILTGPSFAHDLAMGLPTALTLAAVDPQPLQSLLSAPNLRVYRSHDMIGADLGGALKNVIAIACGVAVGAGLGQSARAAVMTRGFAEMSRLAEQLGAQEQTLAGLSGFGDLTLTCTSEGSRNYRYGLSLGTQKGFDPSITVEGAATAQAVQKLAEQMEIDMPICHAVCALVLGRQTVKETLHSLLSRPLASEV